MERCRVAVEDRAFAACVPDLDLRPVLRGAPGASPRHQFCAQPVEFEGEDLAKARNAVTIQDNIAADLQLQAVE